MWRGESLKIVDLQAFKHFHTLQLIRVSVIIKLPPPSSCSGDGSATSGASEEVKSPAAMAQAVKVHQDTSRVMYFA